MTVYEDLKPRELEVLRLMADGLTNREIGEQLYIGVETVRWYARQIYSKMEVSGRKEASEKAGELGWLDADPDSGEEPPKPLHNLPPQFTPFIGRESVITSILDLFTDTRLLTLTGVGGTGKTRLCLRIGEELAAQFRHGVVFVDLASVREANRVPNAIAEALEVFDSGNAPLVEILSRSLVNQRLLLILDNFEHVLEAVSIVTELLTAAPHIKILATSREALRLSGEQVYAVPPLTLPENHSSTLEALEQSEAVTLFVQRAQSVRRGFQLTEANAADVVTICQRLDGLPLAIELAAASSRLLSPAAIVQRLDDRFRVLRGGSRDAPQRHQTLRATIDWSYSLLDDGEKTLFARLAVFRGGRSLEAIEAICSHNLAIDVLDGMASLVDKNLMRLEEDFSGEPRFMLLETIHEYAWERLEASGEAEDMRRRHALYFVEFAENVRHQFWELAKEQEVWRLDTELDNLRAALNWALSGNEIEWGLRLVFALDSLWIFIGHHVEGQRWIDHALEFLDDVSPLFRARILHNASWLALLRQEQGKIRDYGSQALELYQELDDKNGIGLTMTLLAYAEIGQTEDFTKALSMTETGLKFLREDSDLGNLLFCFDIVAIFLNLTGEYERAKQVCAEAIKIAQPLNTNYQGLFWGQMGLATLGEGKPDEAQTSFETAIKIYNDFGLKYYVASNLKRTAAVYCYKGQFEQAAQLLSTTEYYLDTANLVWHADEQIEVDRTLTLLRENMDDTTFQAAWDEGRQMTLDEAVAFVLAG